jgi:tetratricopeptide (TPR) repeat protein
LLITPKLIEILNPAELQAVVAHEAGHIRYHHFLFYMLLFISYLLLMLGLSEPLAALLNYGLYKLAEYPWGADLLWAAGGSYWKVVLSLPMLLLLLLYLRYVLGFFMRHFERQADLHALDFMHDPAPLANALNHIARVAGINPRQPSWHHFSIAQRVQALILASPGQAARAQGRLLRRASLILSIAIILVGGMSLAMQQWGISANLRQLTLERLQEQQHQFNMKYFEAHASWQQGQESEAIAAMEELLQTQPHNPQVLNDLAHFLLNSATPQDQGKALELALRATSGHPDIAAFWDTLAQACYANRQYQQAYAAAQTAIEKLTPEDHKKYNDYYQMRLQFFKLTGEQPYEP